MSGTGLPIDILAGLSSGLAGSSLVLGVSVLAIVAAACFVSRSSASKKPAAQASSSSSPSSPPVNVPVTILYATTSGKARRFADSLAKELFAMQVSGFRFAPSVVNLATYDQDNLEHEQFVLFVVSTFTGGTLPEDARGFGLWLSDAALDFRVSKNTLGSVQYAVFGLGDSVYGAKDFCTAAKDLDRDMAALGATRMAVHGEGDDSTGIMPPFDAWRLRVLPRMCELFAQAHGEDSTESGAGAGAGAGAGCGSGCGSGAGASTSTPFKQHKSWEELDYETKRNMPKKERRRLKRLDKEAQERQERTLARQAAAAARAKAADSGATAAAAAHDDEDVDDVTAAAAEDMTEEDRINDQMLVYVSSDDEDGEKKEPLDPDALVDMEDIGSVYNAARASAGAGSGSSGDAADEKAGPVDLSKLTREMVTPSQRRALTKEGYKIIGTHSAVKLCRWTKHMLRGRGGCYKHTFYGITSYSCMEMTCSLACASKCTFCWRHHKNPVGREWRWKVDSPEKIVEEGVARHQAMINEMRGVPGVKMDRWHDAFNIQHCALSLVGEPIMYPHINQLLRLLHERDISSFLVNNAQFPEAIASLEPVTQLYVSIDAATRDTLKAVDRPLFSDFWERFLASLRHLRDKGQRTVYRLTLVKEYNMTEVEEYAKLIALGQPDLIEVKAVTYSGKSDGSNLTIKNSPWHDEVRGFCEALAARIGDHYELAAEHRHSCCVLISHTKLKVDGAWHTWIDYPKFHALMKEYYATDGAATFETTDYLAPTPTWAVYNAVEAGFDPVETRFRRNKAGVVSEIEYKASESGCG